MVKDTLERVLKAKSDAPQPDYDFVLLQALAASEAKSGLCVVDVRQENHPMIYCNQAMCDITGYSVEEMVGRNCRFLQGQGTDPAKINEIRSAVAQGKSASVVIKNYRKDGRPFWNELTLSPIRSVSGKLLYYVGVQNDVTYSRETEDALRQTQQQLARTNQLLEAKVAERTLQLKEANAQLKHDALHDGLTGLANRALFQNHLHRTLDLVARGESEAYTVIFLDLDRFKAVNDTLGHACGDALLIEAAERLRGCLRPADIVARRGGDEFTILARTPEGTHQARRLCHRIQAQLSQAFWLGEAGERKEVSISASMGVVVGGGRSAQTRYAHPEEVLRDADIALYRAKALGRARHVFFELPMREDNQEAMSLESDLRLALRHDELRLMYQPILSTDGQRALSLEALVRWQHPSRGLLRPGAFLPLAEKAGLMVALDRWVLRHACEQMVRWQVGRPDTELSLSVNVSSAQLSEADTLDFIRGVIEDTGINPAHLHLELTEDAMVSSSPQVKQTLSELSKMGIDLHIDDFGTGYSSLSYLQSVPSDVVKLDRSFVMGLGRNDKSEALVRGVVNLAHELNKHVIAEGVETPQQLEHLKGLGCAYVQGNFLSKPLSVANVSHFLDRQVNPLN